jgi:hypothetical protein
MYYILIVDIVILLTVLILIIKIFLNKKCKIIFE